MLVVGETVFQQYLVACGVQLLPLATRKSQSFYRNPMLGTLDFTGSEHRAPFDFP